jgi:hypothetical protein
MRRYQKWLSVGLLALTPSLTLAGPLNSPIPNGSVGSSKPAKAPKKESNQEIANKIAAALRKAKLNGFDIEIKVENGIATLDGMVASPEQRAAAQKAAMVAGITRVNNRLAVGEGSVKQAAAPRSAGRSQPIRMAGYQGGVEVPDPAPPASPPAVMGQGATPPAAIPAYGPPSAAAGHIAYNQPNLPNYAWPAYAQYPNYAAVTYPSQYAASAWPYIGPFYPYPQVPLGWRKAQLEWDDGYWNLNFRARTDRWWWFLDPRNW